MTEGFLESRGIAYRHSDLKPDRPTLLYIHGLSGSLSAWYPYEKRFEKKYNSVTFDLRGHGKSKRWKGFDDYRIDRSVEDIQALIEHLKLSKVTLVGHSLGTLVALAYVNAHSEHVDSLILLAPTSGLRELPRTKISAPFVAAANRLLRILPVLRKRGYRVDYGKFANTPDFDIERIFLDVRNTGLHSYLYFLQHIYEFDDSYEWGKISERTLIVHGGRDTYIPLRYATRLATVIPSATFSILSNANHILVVNNIEEVSNAMADFVR
jgi:pimeloyl-ACP methyl ester carboxylesterase